MKKQLSLFLSMVLLLLTIACKKEKETDTLKYAPEITLNGSNPMTLLIFSTYLEPGATATDVEDGNLTSSIGINGNINTSMFGSYTITYEVTDSDGNQDLETRIVNVVNDSIAPNLILNGSNPLTISLNSIYSEPGLTATDNILGNISSSVAVAGSVNINLVGSYTLTYTVSDNSGNTATATRTVIVKNDADYLTGFYICSNPAFGAASPWSQTVTASNTINNRIVFSKFGNYTNNNSIVANVSGSSITIVNQVVIGIGSNGCTHQFIQNGANPVPISLISGKWNFSISYFDEILPGNGCIPTSQVAYIDAFVQN